MNENLNLVEILKDCPKGTSLYSSILGEVIFERICIENFPIEVSYLDEYNLRVPANFLADGRYFDMPNGECVLFPSKEQRDLSKFKVSKPKFDPNTLKPFDKVLARGANNEKWIVTLYGFKRYTIDGLLSCFSCANGAVFRYCIPYNDETKHLVGTTDEAPEHYRYWED